jgi:trk system potassium uptake protein
MRVIVIGAGEVGQHLARTLSAERHEVTVIDEDPARVEALQAQLDALVVCAGGSSPRVLSEHGVGHADLLCAVTQRDEVNLIAAMAAKRLGARRTVARVRDDDFYEGQASFARDVLDIDFLVHPERATADDLAEAILLPGAVQAQYFVGGRVAVAETILTDRSPLIDNPLGERRMIRPYAVFGLIRDGRVMAAEPFHKPRPDDHLLVAADRDDIRPVIAHVAGRARRVRDVMVFGGGRVGLPLARRLQGTELRVTVMERDPARARLVAERLPRSTVLLEEGVDKDTLLAQGVSEVGAFVACAGDDRANLLAALHARQLGAELCLAVVSREAFTPLVGALGVDAAFSPRLVTAGAILRAVRGESVNAMHILHGGAEVLEVHTDAGCPADGRTIQTAAERARARIVAIVRDGRMRFPAEDDRVQAGDDLLLFSTRRAGKAVRATFDAAA